MNTAPASHVAVHSPTMIAPGVLRTQAQSPPRPVPPESRPITGTNTSSPRRSQFKVNRCGPTENRSDKWTYRVTPSLRVASFHRIDRRRLARSHARRRTHVLRIHSRRSVEMQSPQLAPQSRRKSSQRTLNRMGPSRDASQPKTPQQMAASRSPCFRSEQHGRS